MLNDGRGFLVKCQAERLEMIVLVRKRRKVAEGALLELNCLAGYNHFRAGCMKTSSRTIRSLQPPRLRRQECHKFTYSMCKAIVQHAFLFCTFHSPINDMNDLFCSHANDMCTWRQFFPSSDPQTAHASLIVSKRGRSWVPPRPDQHSGP